jgi:N6-adenosine-specific RNA methylase IME4
MTGTPLATRAGARTRSRRTRVEKTAAGPQLVIPGCERRKPTAITMDFARAPFQALPFRAYDLIVADPPWPTRRRSPKGEGKSYAQHYGAMSFAAIEALPVADLMARDCVLLLCVPWGLVWHGGDPLKHFAGFDAGHSRAGAVMHAWGLRYSSGGCWRKTTVTGKVAFGTGYRVRDACEPFMIGIQGYPITSRRERNIFDGLRREHSRKPEELYAWCERFMPGARRLDLFSRATRPGWDAWGYEAGKFDPVVNVQQVAA